MDAKTKTMNQELTSSAFHGASCSAEMVEMVERYIASIQQDHDRWNNFREQAMDRQQFTLVARYGDVCDALKMAINQARKILLPNSSLIGGNGEKVQTLIAGTFERYDAGKVKFFCQKLIHIMLKKGEIIVFCSLMRHILQFPACQKSSNP
jgi:hypothetical protein